MSEELEKCPFCGAPPTTDVLMFPPGADWVKCSNSTCATYGYVFSTKLWQDRPLESALRSDNERLGKERDEARTLAEAWLGVAPPALQKKWPNITRRVREMLKPKEALNPKEDSQEVKAK